MAKDTKYELKGKISGVPSPTYPFATEDGWSSENFFKWYDAFNQVQNLDVGTTEGLDTFHSWFHSLVKDELVDSRRVEEVKDGLVQIAKSALVGSSKKNIAGVIGLAERGMAIDLAMKYRPFYDSSSDAKYQDSAKKVENAQNISQDVQNDPRAYLDKRFEGLDEQSKQAWGLLARELIQHDLTSSRKEALQAMDAENPVGKYFEHFFTAAQRKIEPMIKARSELGAEREEAYKVKTTELKRDLNPYEKAEIDKTFADRENKLEEEHKEGMIAVQIVSEVVGEAIHLADEARKKKEEAEKVKKDSGSS
jgi:hypothetical protein